MLLLSVCLSCQPRLTLHVAHLFFNLPPPHSSLSLLLQVHSLCSVKSKDEVWATDHFRFRAEGWTKLAGAASAWVSGYCIYQSLRSISALSKISGIVINGRGGGANGGSPLACLRRGML